MILQALPSKALSFVSIQYKVELDFAEMHLRQAFRGFEHISAQSSQLFILSKKRFVLIQINK
jgi:hypothetical protein